MFFRRLLLGILLFANGAAFGQSTFTKANKLYLGTDILRSTLPMGFFDLNGDFHDDLVTLHEGKILTAYINQGNGIPMKKSQLSAPVAGNPEWSFAAGDLDNDGIPEILTTGVYNSVKVYKYDKEIGFMFSHKFSSESYGQGSNLVDFDKDGDLDYFLCNDEGESRLFLNDGNGRFTIERGRLDFSTTPESDMSGNYGSEWLDIDGDGGLELYMAKCSVRAQEASDPRRINQLLKKDGEGIYRDVAPDIGLDYGDQSWASTFSDLDNDGDMDCIIVNHYTPHLILENNGGKFEQVKYLEDGILSFAFEVLTADFDNNGYEDILITGEKDFIFYNQGGMQFVIEEMPFDRFDVHTASIGDANHDGFIDAYVGYGLPILQPGNRNDGLWINQGNDNHFITLSLSGVQSNMQGVGATISLYYDEGLQVRQSKAGQSYGVVVSKNIHFGLGNKTAIDSIVVEWPSGQKDVILDLPVDQHLLVTEGGCHSQLIEVMRSENPLCPPATVAFTTDADWQNVTWSDGSTGNTVSISSPGSYSAWGVNAEGCPVASRIITIESSELMHDFLPYPDSLTICLGDSLSIFNKNISGIVWGNGSESFVVFPENSSLYGVSITDVCDNVWIDSVLVEIALEDVTGYADTIKKGDQAILSIGGKVASWYFDVNDSQSFFTGDTLIIDTLTQDRSFYAELIVYPKSKDDVIGESRSMDMSPYASNAQNADMYFDVYSPLVIKSITSYTDVVGDREVVIFNNIGEEVFSKRISMVEGKNVMELNAELVPGNGYRITTDQEVNIDQLGFEGPRLERSAEDVFFPYVSEGLISIEGSGSGPNYYYFYDWNIASITEACISDRIEVKVVVDFNESTLDQLPGLITLYPNPVADVLSISHPDVNEGDILNIYAIDGRLIAEHRATGKTTQLNTTNIKSGIYLLRIISEGRSGTSRFVKN
jgi:hypothetical protein